MIDILGGIIYLVFLIFIAVTMILGLVARIKGIKKARAELREVGNLASTEERLTQLSKFFGLTIGSSMIISIMLFYIFKLKFSTTNFIGIVFVVFIFEIGIGAVIGVVKHIIESTIELKKKKGTLVAIITLIMFIILEASYLYIKDFKKF